MKRLLLFCVGVLLGCETASASIVTFYQNRAAFESALVSSATIDFEGIVGADNDIRQFNSGIVLDGVTFTGSGGNPLLYVVGRDSSGIIGQNPGPYNSALLFADGSSPITADLTTAGTGRANAH